MAERVATSVAAGHALATTDNADAIVVRKVPIERVNAAMKDLDEQAAASNVPREQWSAEQKAAAKTRLLRALQVTEDPSRVEVIGVSRFRSTTLIRPDGPDREALAKFAQSLGATRALWTNEYLGKTDTIVEKPVTSFGTRSGYWGDGRAWRDDRWPDYWGNSTTWVPVRVEADEYLYVAFFLRDSE